MNGCMPNLVQTSRTRITILVNTVLTKLYLQSRPYVGLMCYGMALSDLEIASRLQTLIALHQNTGI